MENITFHLYLYDNHIFFILAYWLTTPLDDIHQLRDFRLTAVTTDNSLLSLQVGHLQTDDGQLRAQSGPAQWRNYHGGNHTSNEMTRSIQQS